ncbi:TPA: type 1 fimbrial protein [Enterobacter asburiae]|uniref:fimbrial protein n=1 Tax=Enterobacter TaxID=547 RepID=UPI00285FBFEB|nr:type 1 fimbrial protein [Enterobacter asburiae]
MLYSVFKINIRRVCLYVIAGSCLLSSFSVFALCRVTNAGLYTVNVYIQKYVASVGSELPEGSIIHSQRVIGFKDVSFFCDSSPIIRFDLVGGTLYPGATNIYQTGIAGVGVRFRGTFDNKLYPYSVAAGGLMNAQITGWLAFAIEFIKMGPIVSGGTFNQSLMPEVRINVTDNDRQLQRLAYHFIRGSIDSLAFAVPSCVTPNFTWDLGSITIDALRAKGDATQWVDTPVTLTNCPQFPGRLTDASGFIEYKITGGDTSTVTQRGSAAPNTLTMMLRPNTAAIDSANGVIGTDSSATTHGFGVQLGSKQSGTYIPQDLSTGIVLTPALNSSGTFTFPLGARIIRTSDGIRGGALSSSVTYIINYQ